MVLVLLVRSDLTKLPLLSLLPGGWLDVLPSALLELPHCLIEAKGIRLLGLRSE